MHVCYIHQYFSTQEGSTGTRSYEMSQALRAAGHSVTMVCGINDVTARCFKLTGRITEQMVDGIRTLIIDEPYSNKFSFARRVLAFGRFAREATRVVQSLDVDLVYATSTPLTVGIPGMRGARSLGVPFVFEVRDLWPELPIAMGVIRNPVAKWYLRRLEQRIYAAATRIVAVAPGIMEGIQHAGVPTGKLTFIPNGCDLDVFTPSDEPLNDPRFGDPGDFRLVFSGAHGPANGLDAVLDAAAELKRRGERGVRFCFIGDGKAKPGLVERVERDGLQDYTSFVGNLPKRELAEVLPRMDVGMMILRNVPAFYYGTSPNKFFDYISAGLPVINNYPGWLAGMIEKHELGRVVPPDSAAAMADGVLWLKERRAMKREFGKRSRALAEAEFSRAHQGKRLVSLLEEVHTTARRREGRVA